jgi:hypothetical protein
MTPGLPWRRRSASLVLGSSSVTALAHRRVLPLAALALLSCAGPLATAPVRFDDRSTEQQTLAIEGLGSCSPDQPDELTLRTDAPLVVIVHGCFSSGGAFRELAQVFEFHGQQTACFNYHDRRGLRPTADRLRTVLDHLGRRMPDQQIVVLGHSQGGMVSRIAMSDVESDQEPPAGRFRLVTVSSPLNGIDAAAHCGLPWLHWLSLGITSGVCQAITGSKWPDIHPRSGFWTDPDPLSEGVSEHLMIVSDERGTCRRRDEEGECEEDDFVFTTTEQANPRITADERVTAVTIEAGHVAIVGEHGASHPAKLIEALQAHGVMLPTPPELQVAYEAMIRRVYF